MSGDTKSEDYEYHEADFTLEEHYPKSYAAQLGPSIPAAIRHVFPDMVEDATRNRNAAAVLTNCRGVMEVALQQLEEQAGIPPSKLPLIKRIDQLAAKGVITAPLAEWAHQIRLDGNRSAHELIGDPVIARAYVDFLKLFLEVSFDLPERIKKMKDDRDQPPPSKPMQGRSD